MEANNEGVPVSVRDAEVVAIKWQHPSGRRATSYYTAQMIGQTMAARDAAAKPMAESEQLAAQDRAIARVAEEMAANKPEGGGEWMAQVCEAAAQAMEACGLGARTGRLREVAATLRAPTPPSSTAPLGSTALKAFPTTADAARYWSERMAEREIGHDVSAGAHGIPDEPASSTAPEAVLWCLHVRGPDDVHPAPSRAAAEYAAEKLNRFMADRGFLADQDGGLLVNAVAAPWPHSAESHAASVGAFEADWILPQSAATPTPSSTAPEAVHVECRECRRCDHVGINDESDTQAACHDCDWSGPSPAEDKCPGCARENCMGAACPKCGGLYAWKAEAQITTPAQPAVQGEREAIAVLRAIAADLSWRTNDNSLWPRIRAVIRTADAAGNGGDRG